MLRAWVLIAVGLYSTPPTTLQAAEPDRPTASPLTTWREALAQFRHAAQRAHAGQTTEATAVLRAFELNVRQPYSRHAQVLVCPLPGAFASGERPPTQRSSAERARAAEQLAEYDIALAWAKLARDLTEAKSRSGSYRQVAWLLMATGRFEEALEAYDQVIANPGPFSGEYEIKQLQQRKSRIRALMVDARDMTARIEFIRSDFLDGLPHLKQPDRLLTALERLIPLLGETNQPAQRRQIHALLQKCLLELDDVEGLAAWEDLMLSEDWLTIDDRAGIAAQRADRAYKQREFPEAERQWRLICSDYPESHQVGTAQFNLGVLLQEQGKLDAAIAEYLKLFPSNANDREPGSNIMVAYRNYRNRAAKQLSQCFEAKGDARQALDWIIQSRDKYPYQSWCGTCMMQEQSATSAKLVRLKWKAGKKAEALQMAEEMVFVNHPGTQAFHVPQLIAEEYFEQGRAAELLQRVEKFRKDRFDRLKDSHRQSPDELNFDGHTDATRLIVDCLEVLRLHSENDLAGLWDWIQTKDVTALEASLPANLQQAMVGLAVKHLLSNRARAIPFLKKRFRHNDIERGWSAVLLAKLGEVKNVEALHRLVTEVEEGSQPDDQKRSQRCQADFFYAILLTDPSARSSLFERYSNTTLVYPAQDAMYRERNVREAGLAGGR